MIREKNFNLMCSEVLKILEYLPKSDVDKLPLEMIKLFKENQIKDIKIDIDPNKTIFEQNVCEETLVIMFIIFRNYWATKEEKIEFDKLLKENQIKLGEVYSYNNLFKNNKNENEKETEPSNTEKSTSMIEYKETIITKIINIIKKIFRIQR